MLTADKSGHAQICPQNYPFACMGESGPARNTWAHPSPHCASIDSSVSVGLTVVSNGQTDTQTDHETSVTIGHVLHCVVKKVHHPIFNDNFNSSCPIPVILVQLLLS